VVGDPSNAWRKAIAGLMAVEEDAIMIVEPARIQTKVPVLATTGGAPRGRHQELTGEQVPLASK
jgi:hypothetical protein